MIFGLTRRSIKNYLSKERKAHTFREMKSTLTNHGLEAHATFLSLILFAVSLPFFSQADDEKAEPVVAVEVGMAKVIRTTLSRSITVYGKVQPAPAVKNQAAAAVQLSPAVSGVVTKIYTAEGQQVKKGDLLFQLDSRAADAALEQAETRLNAAKENSARQEKLKAARATSEKLILEAKQALAEAVTAVEKAKVALSFLKVSAPVSGTVTSFSAKVGEAADPTTVLAEIVDLNRLIAVVRVPATLIDQVKTGQKAAISVSGGKKATTAVVSFITPGVEANSDTVTVRLSPEKGGKLRSGQFVSARIIVAEKADCLAVPHQAVYTDPDGHSTLSLVVDGISQPVSVTTGLQNETLIEVSGEKITAGAVVITIGSYNLPEGTKVRALKK